MPSITPVPTTSERRAAGRAMRSDVPLEAHAEFRPSSGRDPLGLLREQATTRVADLVPVRHGRMLQTPFTFFRGAALIMASDLSRTPTTTLRAQLCGDAHLSNFGAYGSPERRLVFDLNDFDETLPGPFEWDVKRLAASLVVAGRDNGYDAADCRRVAVAAVEKYRTAMREFAKSSILDVWYASLDIDQRWPAFREAMSGKRRKRTKEALTATDASLAKARKRTNAQAHAKLSDVVDGHKRIIADPPLVIPISDVTFVDQSRAMMILADMLQQYHATIQPDRRVLAKSFTLLDVAHRVVGVGSVGTRAWVLLLEGSSPDEVLVLQAKEASRSVLAGFVGESEHEHQGERVVAGQRLMQASSDIFLGWARARNEDRQIDYYVRQQRDWKMSFDVAILPPDAMEVYARMCGWTLARAHARSGDRASIAGYLGKSATFAEAVADFAESYADQNERDHALMAAAAAAGTIDVIQGL